MNRLSEHLPLSGQRTSIQRYLAGIVFSFDSVAGRIIEERMPVESARDPLRPSLVLWASDANGGDRREALPVAAAFALFDRFMLLHDELGDDSAESIGRWGLGQTLNAGDAFYALAFRTLARDVGDPARRLEAARLVGQAVLEAIEARPGDAERDAPMTAAALRAGALVAGASPLVAAAYSRAGTLLGLAGGAEDVQDVRRLTGEAIAALRRHATAADLAVFEEVAEYLARRDA
ncbi:MAG TPA: hypothetical protein VHR97_05375 [Candidatus Baltobacteraceae bacterium]|jgi:hypothetical protein|nr:hypothetical protein [Candidatus Baltobacteraceae bacterium]